MKQITDVRGNSYDERLKNAEMTSLRERRERGDAIETFKTLNGFNKVEKNQWFNIADDKARATRSTSSVSELGEERKTNVLRIEGARLDIRKHSYTVRAAKLWNKIPEKVRAQKSVNGFKKAYDDWRISLTTNTR